MGHLKVNKEAEKGLSLTEVCRISMRTRNLLSGRLRWLDSAMAELHLQAGNSRTGRIMEEEFISVLRPFTGGVLDSNERRCLFKRLDGENKGFITLQLTDSEHKKCEELKTLKKSVESVASVKHVISAMKLQSANASDHCANLQQQPESNEDSRMPAMRSQSADASSPFVKPQQLPEEKKNAPNPETPRDRWIRAAVLRLANLPAPLLS